MAITAGSRVMLTKQNNGSSAFDRLDPLTKYTVEALGSKCSHCKTNGLGESLKILGLYYCAAAFDEIPAPQQGSANEARPARSEPSDVDFFDTLPDPTFEEMKTLPTLEQLYEAERKKQRA